MQSIYLKKDETYFVYVVANLDESNIPDGKGNVHTFFDTVETYKDLLKMYVQHRVLSPAELGKMIMTTDDPMGVANNGIRKIVYNNTNEVFAPKVDLYRLQAKFIVNIYNKANSDDNGKYASNASGVTPTSINAANFPRNSYLVRHDNDYADTDGDGKIGEASFGEFYSSQPALLPTPAPGNEIVQYTYGSNAGNTTSYYK